MERWKTEKGGSSYDTVNMADNKGTFSCKICQCDRELTTCNKCMNDMMVVMTKRIMQENPDLLTLRADIKHILEEIRDIKECLNLLPIQGIKLKPIPRGYEELF